jgi:hypothetical protein
MTSPAARSEASSLRMLVLDDGKSHDVFDVLDIVGGVARVRSPFLFEIGEELAVQIDDGGQISEAQARVRAHVGPADMRITELELTGRTEPRATAGS